MKYYETSACSGSNIENMFFAMIDEIALQQQARRKTNHEEDPDLNPPLTTENLASLPPPPPQDSAGEARLKLKRGEGWRKLCCW